MPGIPRFRAAQRLVLLSFLWQTSHHVMAYSVPLNGDVFLLLDRAVTCSLSDFQPCAGSNLPNNFCCPSTSVCNVLAGNTTIVCCPSGKDCKRIQPISCDISQQNADLHPAAGVKTSALNGVLKQCGTGTCCPFGYSCDSTLNCVRDDNQNAVPITTASKSTATATSTSTLTVAPSSSSSSSASTSSSTSNTIEELTTMSVVPTSIPTVGSANPTSVAGAGAVTSGSDIPDTAQSSPPAPSTASVVGGVVGGLAGLLLVGSLAWFLVGYRLRRRNAAGRGHSDLGHYRSDSTSSFKNIISNPLPIGPPELREDNAFRSDFIRKMSPPPTGVVPQFARDGSSASRAAGPYAAVSPIRGMRNSAAYSLQVPRKARAREPSMEEINVGVDPSIIPPGGFHKSSLMPSPLHLGEQFSGAGGDRASRRRSKDRLTTFTSMMTAAKLNLSSFVPDSPPSTPRQPPSSSQRR